jgi:hypothetical protein
MTNLHVVSERLDADEEESDRPTVRTRFPRHNEW